MASPSKPVNIASPRLLAQEIDASSSFASGTPLGTPDLRALRAQYAAANTAPPNIPLRSSNGTPSSQSRYISSSPLPGIGSSLSSRLGPSGLGGISARRPSTPVGTSNEFNRADLDDLPDEEKAKVLRRHLVSREERQGRPESSRAISRTASFTSSHPTVTLQEDSDAFPIPYDAPGADVT